MESKNIILEKLEKIEKHIVGLKSIFNVEELREYTGFTKSYIYKLVHTNEIPYSKPNGKLLFFERAKIDEWLLRNSIKSNDEISKEAINYALKKRKSPVMRTGFE
ncbi:MAG: helix-turn-helix domain-containing protein [Capnocytophaga felis]|nr:helix-turn-helix domain-containing protein [Capnocytophaga felis]